MSTRNNNAFHIPEPPLLFNYAQLLADPKDGLFLFGPLDDRTKPAEMRIGVIGTRDGIARYNAWVKRNRSYIPAAKTAAHHLAFPGFEAAFRTKWPELAVVELEVSKSAIENALRIGQGHKRVYEAVDIYDKAIRKHLVEEDTTPAMWFVIIPDTVHEFCRPKSSVRVGDRIVTPGEITRSAARSLIKSPSLFPDENAAAEPYRYEVDFHNQLKARLLDKQAVLQIVRESTIAPDEVAKETGKVRRLQDPANVSWNLSTTAYFKAGGRPWTLGQVRKGVCYIGLVFKKTEIDPEGKDACCGAQMFLGTGDGVVFKGAVGPWYSADTKECHLSSGKAQQIAAMVVDAYKNIHGEAPTELFIHARQKFSDPEWEGFSKAVPSSTKLVGVRIRPSTDVKLSALAAAQFFEAPRIRFTNASAICGLSASSQNFKLMQDAEVPNPLLVEIIRGTADLSLVMQDVLGLTKLNFNACIYGDGLPVTLRFASDVGEILTAAPLGDLPPLPFKHYI